MPNYQRLSELVLLEENADELLLLADVPRRGELIPVVVVDGTSP